MSAASDRIQELIYPTKFRFYSGLGDPPDTRVTAEDLKAVIDERHALLEAATKALAIHEDVACSCVGCAALRSAIKKARGT